MRALEVSFEATASRRRLRTRAWAGSAIAFCLAAALTHAASAEPVAPRRVVSLNLCADELVLRLADRDQIAAVTWLARDSRGSTVANEAAGLPVTRGLSEEVVALEPDLVIAGAFTTRTTVGLLKRIGLPVMELGLPADFEGVRAQIRTVAAAVGHSDRGEAMISDLNARLAAIPSPDRRPRVLVMRPNAFTVAPGSLGDAILNAAGVANAGAEIGQDRTGSVPLEAAALAAPDLIVLDERNARTPSLADTVLHHSVLKAVAAEGRTLSIPNRLWTCPGPQIAEVVERLAAARQRIERHTDAAHPPSPRTRGEDRDDPVVVAVSPKGDGEGTSTERASLASTPHPRLPPRFADDEVGKALSPRAGRGDAHLPGAK